MGIRTLDLRRLAGRRRPLRRRARPQAPAAVRAARRRLRRPSRGPRRQHRGARAGPVWLATHHPDAPPDHREPRRLGRARHPLDEAGRLVQEDLCVLVERTAATVLEAASLCFPSHWRLHEKLGRSLAAIHAPVPHYAEELEAKVDTFFDRLRVDRPVRAAQPVGPLPRRPLPARAPRVARVVRPRRVRRRSGLAAQRAPDPGPTAAHRRRAVHDQDPAVPDDRAPPSAPTWPSPSPPSWPPSRSTSVPGATPSPSRPGSSPGSNGEDP